MSETEKANERRIKEGWFQKYIRLPGIDIGCGDRVIHEDFVTWDLKFGNSDAQYMLGVGQDFLTVYSSHLLEHLNDPVEALVNWYRILKRGGCLIVVVPHRDLYEKRLQLPSHNPEHKTFWLPYYSENESTWGLMEALQLALPPTGWQLELLQVADRGEYAIESVVRKLK